MPDVVDPVEAITAGGMAYVDDRMDEARAQWETAFRALREVGATAAAARVATLLGELHWGGLGNASIGRGWLERARRLLDEAGPCVEEGYWELARLACDRPDPVEIEGSARRALAVATRFGDVGLHTRALGDLGYALVSQGRLAAGYAHLDEALAALSGGEVQDTFAVTTTCCALLSACDRAGDADRAAEWLRFVRETVLAPAGGRPRMLGAHCQVALGGVLCAVDEWSQADEAVRSVLERGSGAIATQRVEAAARLADLHVQRGRLEEAAELLAPIEDEPAAAGPLARLHLARSRPDVALAVLLRAGAVLGGDAPLVRAGADLAGVSASRLPGARTVRSPSWTPPATRSPVRNDRCSPLRRGSLSPRARRRTPTPPPAPPTRSPSGSSPMCATGRRRCCAATAPRPPDPPRARGPSPNSPRGRRRSWPACAAVTPTARSPHGCSSPPRPSSTTSVGCSSSSASAPAPRPPPLPPRRTRRPDLSAAPPARRERAGGRAGRR
jgi:hypothetical protein